MRRTLLLFSCCVIVATWGTFAGEKNTSRHVMHEGKSLPADAMERNGRQFITSGLSWVLVDSMANVYGMMSNRVEPLSYDPRSGYLALLHRANTAYGTGSGQLWYNLSSDGGMNWTRVSELNGGAPTQSRYPSGLISNPTGATTMLFAHASPQLQPGPAFGWLMYGVDILGAGTPFTMEDPGDSTYWSNTSMWVADDSPWIFWAARRDNPNNDFYLWRTQDYVTINQGLPPTWASTSWNSGDFHLDIGGEYRNGMSYFGAYGAFAGELGTVDNVGYSKSSDNGATWSAWNKPSPDFRSAGLSGFDWHNYGGPGNFSFDMTVDASGKVHFFGIVQDTLLRRSVVELFEGESGWESKMIALDIPRTANLTYNGFNQMGHLVSVATSEDGNVMGVVWVAGGTPTDSLCDVWFSWRSSTTNNWSTPQNLTITPGYYEALLQSARTLRSDGGNMYTMFLARAYQCGLTTFPPSDLACTDIFVTSHTFSAVSNVGDGQRIPNTFELQQNYPNPFNPATNIVFTVPDQSLVNIRVHNILGEEVAVLVNEAKEVGTYNVVFDASGLTSGVYFYTLQSGGFVTSRKMVVLK